MSKTAFFIINADTNVLTPIGVGPVNNSDYKRELVSLASSVAASKGQTLNIATPILSVGDLYSLKAQIVEALDNLPNEELL